MSTVNPVQTTTYYLTSANNPVTFGTGTGIDVSSGTGIGVYGSNAQSWRATNEGAIRGHLYGIDLTAGGSVTNKAGATVSGGHAGIYGHYFLQYGGGVRIVGGVGTVTNAGTISSLGIYGGKFAVYLGAGGKVTNEAGATISGYTEIAGGAGTVTNAGDIGGVELQAGGSVNNKAGGTISGGRGVDLTAGGSVTNGGTISGFRGIELSAGGSVTNKAGGVINSYGQFGTGVRAFGPATLTNAGAITASTIGVGGNAVAIYAAGSVVNKTGATIIGGYGVYFGHNSSGTVTNAGNITGYISPGGNLLFASGVVLATGESLNNQSTGTISGYHAGVWLLRGGSVTNHAGGTISGHDIGILTGGILTPQGGPTTVTNAGAITGEGGVVAIGSAATVTNSGAIAGTKVASVTVGRLPVETLGDGVFMNAGGAVTNKAGGTITGAGDGVYIAGGGAVTNKDAITSSGDFGVGVHLATGGSVANESGATISGWYGVQTGYYDAGAVTNAGRISGLQLGVGVNAGGTVTNKAGATISASGTPGPLSLSIGVRLFIGGTVTNEAGATISGYANPNAAVLSDAIGVYGNGGFYGSGQQPTPTTVENDGKILSNGNGVSLTFGGVVNNRKGGTISGADVTNPIGYGGVRIVGGGGTVTNAGAISGKVGVYMNGYNTGAAETVTNAGTINGTIASVEFAGAGANTLTLKTGSTLNGDAIGSTASGATNALILQGHGTADNNFDGFDTLSVQANGNWMLGGDSTFGATTISSGSLIVAGDVSGGPTTLGDPAGDVAKLVIASTGTWDILDDSRIGLGGSAPSFISNSGLFEKTGGTGTSAIAPGVVNKGSILVSYGALDLEGAVSGKGTDTISGASTLEFDSTVGGGQTVGFTGGGGMLDLLDPLGFAAKIADFAVTDRIELAGDWVFSHFSETGNGNMATLTLANGSNDLSLHFLGDYTAGDFSIASGATTIIGHT
jgi:fibronectin-binding autotransporter adhesin